MELSSSQTKFLRAQAHPLKVVVSVGNKGLSPALLDETRLTLEAHELIKVKLPAIDKPEKKALLATLAEKTGAKPVQLIGRVGVLFRPSKPSKFALPAN